MVRAKIEIFTSFWFVERRPVAVLLQGSQAAAYVSAGPYYARLKIKGKIIRQSLQTTVFTDAKMRLADFIKEKATQKAVVAPIPFTTALDLCLQELNANHGVKESSKRYRKHCIRKIQLSWPQLWDNDDICHIPETACREWSTKLRSEIACHYFNNVIGTLNMRLLSLL